MQQKKCSEKRNHFNYVKNISGVCRFFVDKPHESGYLKFIRSGAAPERLTNMTSHSIFSSDLYSFNEKVTLSNVDRNAFILNDKFNMGLKVTISREASANKSSDNQEIVFCFGPCVTLFKSYTKAAIAICAAAKCNDQFTAWAILCKCCEFCC